MTEQTSPPKGVPIAVAPGELPGSSVPFSIAAGAPMKITFTSREGQRFEMIIQTAIFDVVQAEGQMGPDGNPLFFVKAALSADTKKIP